MTAWLTTPRLALRRFTHDDLDWLTVLQGNPEVTRHVGGPLDRAGTEGLLENRILKYYDDHPGLGIWITVERATGERLGYHLLNHIRGESIIQVGYVLDQPAWGKGYATEMAAALLRYGFVELGLQTIAGMTHPDNVASQQVLLKIGLHRHGERSFADPFYAAQGPLAWFERDAADWIREREGAPA